ncbi:MAG: hypothetical protein AAGA03_01720 [Planctomycetota bacterium]
MSIVSEWLAFGLLISVGVLGDDVGPGGEDASAPAAAATVVPDRGPLAVAEPWQPGERSVVIAGRARTDYSDAEQKLLSDAAAIVTSVGPSIPLIYHWDHGKFAKELRLREPQKQVIAKLFAEKKTLQRQLGNPRMVIDEIEDVSRQELIEWSKTVAAKMRDAKEATAEVLFQVLDASQRRLLLQRLFQGHMVNFADFPFARNHLTLSETQRAEFQEASAKFRKLYRESKTDKEKRLASLRIMRESDRCLNLLNKEQFRELLTLRGLMKENQSLEDFFVGLTEERQKTLASRSKHFRAIKERRSGG